MHATYYVVLEGAMAHLSVVRLSLDHPIDSFRSLIYRSYMTCTCYVEVRHTIDINTSILNRLHAYPTLKLPFLLDWYVYLRSQNKHIAKIYTKLNTIIVSSEPMPECLRSLPLQPARLVLKLAIHRVVCH